MRRKKALYAVVGGVVGAVLVMVAGSFSPLGAQNELSDTEFGTITCESIRVGSPNESSVLITGETFLMFRRGEGVDDFQRVVKMYGTDEAGGQIIVFDQNGKSGCWITGHESEVPILQAPPAKVVIGGSTSDGGYVAVRGKDGEFGAKMQAGEIVVFGKDEMTGAWVSVDEKNSGRIILFDNDDEGENIGVHLGIDEHGGLVSVGGKGGKGMAQIAVTEHGERVDVFGKVDKESRASMSVNEYGNGAVSTWDKNGYRLK